MGFFTIFSCKKTDTIPTPTPVPPAPTNTIPTLSTTVVSNITTISATSGGVVTDNGGSTITASGICWSTTTGPTIVLSTKTTDGNGLIFASNLTALAATTTYYVRAYATNSIGTAYGNEVSFATTTLTVPIITTSPITNITSNSASSGGIVSSNGGSNISVSGICWSPTNNPTIALPTKTTDGNGVNFTSNITGLTAGTTYFVRAYATNTTGTAYGNEVSFVPAVSFAAFDNAMLAKMVQYNVPGMSIAVIKDEKLVYLKSYGKSDVEANVNATNDDLYRIASVSKPVTAIAILKMVQDGLITLDQKVFGTGSILGNDYGVVPASSSKDLITVRHLLEHKSGWTNVPDDPMFRALNLTQTQLIADLLSNRPLTTAPGSTVYYLNFGYCVLGRVIEKISGLTYENYVKANVLSPCGISSMKIGGSTLLNRFPNEVKYYQPEFSPYAMNVTRFDSHGGWIASSKDLAKLMVKIDRNTLKPDIITPSLLSQLYFGSFAWGHYGSIPGTSAILYRMNNTFSYVMLTNTRTESDGNIILNDLNSTIQTQINAVGSWPSYDLF